MFRRLGELDGETRIVIKATGNYHLPVAYFLYVSVVNAMLVHGYGNNSLRRAKTDKEDAIKLANYGLDHWLALPRVCFKTVKVTRQGYRQDRQQHGNKELSSRIWWQSGGCF